MKKGYVEISVVKNWFVVALIEMTKKYPFEKISVSELCRSVGVPRSTFYRYYSCKDDIFVEYFSYLGEECSKYFRDNSISGNQYAYEFFKFYGNYVEYFRVLINLHKEYIIFRGILNGVNEKKDVSEKLSSYARYRSFSLFGIYINWIIEGCQESYDELANIFFHNYEKELIEISVNKFKLSHNKLSSKNVK